MELSKSFEIRSPSSASAKYDLIFQDVGDKKLYAEMVEDYIRLLKTGGVFLAEDTLFPAFGYKSGDWIPMCKTLDTFNKRMADYPQFESALLPIGDGLTIAVKLN